MARSLLSQSVESDEVGRIFSSLSLASLLVPFFSKPLFAFLYDFSLETFPGSWMLLTGLIIWSAMIIMIVLTAMITILVPQLHFAQNELLEEFWTTSDWVEKMMPDCTW